MRREFFRPLALVLGLLGLSASPAAVFAQDFIPATPRLPDVNKRSGLVTRFQPRPVTDLPSDPHRDNFYSTRNGDYAVVGHSNSMLNGGMYGQALSPACTHSVFPYFRGSPGGNASCEKCRPKHKNPNGLGRVAQGLFHPFRPVGSYYQNGSYVPIYDLDPLVPGPGPDLWPHFIQIKDDASFFGH